MFIKFFNKNSKIHFVTDIANLTISTDTVVLTLIQKVRGPYLKCHNFMFKTLKHRIFNNNSKTYKLSVHRNRCHGKSSLYIFTDMYYYHRKCILSAMINWTLLPGKDNCINTFIIFNAFNDIIRDCIV